MVEPPPRTISGAKPIPPDHPMNELQRKLTEIGLSEEMADKAIRTVALFAKTKVPRPLHGIVDDALAGKTPDLGKVNHLLGGIKGFFSDKK